LVSLFPASWERILYGVFGTISALLAAWLFLRIEKKSFREIGLIWESGTFIRFFKGLLTGTLIFSIILIILLSFTELQIERNTAVWQPLAILGYAAIIPLALMEEVAFRSYPFLKLNKVCGVRITQIIVAVAFALYHIVSGWSVQAAFLGPGIWAFVFGLAAVWSGGIALPVGIHVALNVLQPLTGMRGNDNSLWILKYKDGTPENLIAKTDSVGLVIQLIILICAVLLTEYYIRKKSSEII
jgi:membrane protease YdiL (CAAX protease family)